MTASTDFKYRELEDIEPVELAQLLELLKDVGVSPRVLLSYAIALETVEGAKEHEMEVEDALEVNHEVAEDDLVDELHSDARLILIKLDKIKAH